MMDIAHLIPSPEALQARLGADYSEKQTTFRVWAPTQVAVDLCLYDEGQGGTLQRIPMEKVGDLFIAVLSGDCKGKFYTYLVQGVEVVDPYAVSVSLNATRGAIVDLRETDPVGFRSDTLAETPIDDAVVVELHLADFTGSKTSGAEAAGKFLGLTEHLVVDGQKTGLDHLKELGITHVHLMPVAENATVDETPERFGADDNYNWGYDPELYNVPEGSFATDPLDPLSRIREMKAMVHALHKAGIRVIMDVVYNHTYKTLDSHLNRLVPDYYYRQDAHGFSNGSGVGNELASERPMVRKLIIDSLLFWQEEYRIDGFRFDLMALTDINTIKMALQALRAKDPEFLVYGEPWAGAVSALPQNLQTVWSAQNEFGFGLFNEAFRDAIRGDNNGTARGFIQGNTASKTAIEVGLLGSIDYRSLLDGGTRDPINTINYFNAHDNLILEDKLRISAGNPAQIEAMTRFAFGILLTAQGIPFFHVGNEFRRSKKGDANSYHAPLSVNGIDWRLKKENRALFEYVRDLIALRKEYAAFTLRAKAEVIERVDLLSVPSNNLIGLVHRLDGQEARDFLLCMYYNGWEPIELDVAFIFDRLRAERIVIQRIFDSNGRVVVNQIELSRSERIFLNLDPISLTIYKVRILL